MGRTGSHRLFLLQEGSGLRAASGRRRRGRGGALGTGERRRGRVIRHSREMVAH